MSSNDHPRAWMYNRKNRAGLTDEFMSGVVLFLGATLAYNQNPQDMYIPRLCVRCECCFFKIVETVVEHLYKWGFQANYYFWTFHGDQSRQNWNYGEGTYTNPPDPSDNNLFGEMFVDLAGVMHNDPSSVNIS